VAGEIPPPVFIDLSHLAKHFAKEVKIDSLSSRQAEAANFYEIASQMAQVAEIPRFRRF
jgi:hypothetical protein